MATAALLAALGGGCGQAPTAPPEALSPVVAAPSQTEPELRIVVLGDSLAAGLGLAESEAFPAVVESLLRDEGFDVEIINAGVSGDTTAGGLSRIGWVLQQPVDIIVIELGGNDALRGHLIESTENNLREIVRIGRETDAEVVLLGMDVPTNYGPDYAGSFAKIYPRVADEEGAILVPNFVRELGSDPTLLQPDGLHPTAEGQRRLAEVLLPAMIDAIEGLK